MGKDSTIVIGHGAGKVSIPIAEWTLNVNGAWDSSSFRGSSRTYYSSGANGPAEGPVMIEEAKGVPTFSLEGEFQGLLFTTGVIDVMTQSPIEVVICEVFDLDEGEEIISYAVKMPDGQIEVRAWSGGR